MATEQAAAAPGSGEEQLATRLLTAALAIALLGTAWMLDPLALAAFDAPKRVLALLAAAAGATVLILSGGPWRRWTELPPPARWSLLFALLSVLGLLCSVLGAEQPALAADSLRSTLLYALFVPLGASTWLSRSALRRLLWIAALAVMVNVVLSLLQSQGWLLMLSIVQLGGRFATGALLGNEGYVALAAALWAAAALVIGLNSRVPRERGLALLGGLLALSCILVNRQLTSAIALAAAVISILAIRWQRPRVIGLGAGLVVLAAASALVPVLREQTWDRLPVGGVEGYQQLTTQRLAPWAAATEMIAARPWSGHGPGSFARLGQRFRLQAELHWQTRLLPPVNSATFVQAHNEYLQVAAEAGIPTLLAALAALGLLLRGLVVRASSPGAIEPLLLLAVLIAGATAALAWFPLQIPFTAVILLLAAGRSWRLLADHDRAPC